MKFKITYLAGYFSNQVFINTAHRYFTHKTFRANSKLKYFLIFLQTLSAQEDIIKWVRDHRVHHKVISQGKLVLIILIVHSDISTSNSYFRSIPTPMPIHITHNVDSFSRIWDGYSLKNILMLLHLENVLICLT